MFPTSAAVQVLNSGGMACIHLISSAPCFSSPGVLSPAFTHFTNPRTMNGPIMVMYCSSQALEVVKDALAGKGTEGDEFGDKTVLAPLLSGMWRI